MNSIYTLQLTAELNATIKQISENVLLSAASKRVKINKAVEIANKKLVELQNNHTLRNDTSCNPIVIELDETPSVFRTVEETPLVVHVVEETPLAANMVEEKPLLITDYAHSHTIQMHVSEKPSETTQLHLFDKPRIKHLNTPAETIKIKYKSVMQIPYRKMYIKRR